MDYGIVVVACMIGGACNTEAPMMVGGATSAEQACSTANQTTVLNGIGAMMTQDFAAIPDDFTRADQNAVVPIADALRARRVDRLIMRCVEWPAPTRRGRTVSESTYGRAQLEQLFGARMRR
jgi:hypothetical protein